MKAHNLLNCFGEIEVNYSNNLTSSGIIGVDSGVNTSRFKKQEKLELVALNKKQEAFMIEANLVCVKLASSHPFMFIRFVLNRKTFLFILLSLTKMSFYAFQDNCL